jgi:EAL domain-containing protein (putative c-di-GMP-specific phosphodiesterase class I)
MTIFHHQQIVCLETEQPVASELLLRSHSDLSLADMLESPHLFESHITELVTEKIRVSRMLWGGQPNAAIFLNFTPSQIIHPEFDSVVSALSEHVVPGRYIVMEITEDEKAERWELMFESLSRAKRKGIHIAIDDFGKGYSNFNTLVRLSPDIVKLDVSVIQQASSIDSACNAFYRIVEFIQSIGSKVVVEGIETEKSRIIAKRSRAEFGQGYFFHRPCPVYGEVKA